MELTDKQLEKYNRNILLESFGEKGQKTLLNSKVLIIGAGGLGSPASLYLAAAGIGQLGIVDKDKVELSNLQRQILHYTEDLDCCKIDSAENKLKKLNPDTKIVKYNLKVHADNIINLIKKYDFILDCVDNFETKFLINDACVISGKPYSHAGILGWEGQTITYTPENACYRCIFNELPDKNRIQTTNELGVLGAAAGILGSIQATETIKYLIGFKNLLINRLLTINFLSMKFRTIEINKKQNCPVCNKKKPKITKILSKNY